MISRFLIELASRNKLLYWFGWINVGLFALAFIMFQTDDTLILGINAWIKPMKFALSIAAYAWTFGWLLQYTSSERAKQLITVGVIVPMLVEIVLIFLQSYRGTTSHFNIHTAFDGIVFAIMGIFIGMNTVVNLYAVLVFFSKSITLSGPSLWAWRSGLILFFLGSISGGWMVAHLAHTVGAPDGGPGLPFVNWSTAAGDIRAAHFATLHGLQALPLVTYWLVTHSGANAARWSAAFILAYSILCLLHDDGQSKERESM